MGRVETHSNTAWLAGTNVQAVGRHNALETLGQERMDMRIIVIDISPCEIRELLEDNVIDDDGWPEPTTKEIREWARSNGLAVAPKGTLPRDVIEMYERTVRYA